MSKLDLVVKSINKKYENVISTGIPEIKVDRIRFSSPNLNYMTFGGIPRGAITEFAGETGGGKTTTALDIVSNAQKLFEEETTENEPTKKVVYVDCENTLDEGWAKKLNVDIDNMILLRPFKQTAEQIFQMVIELIETGEVGLVVIDSLAVMVSQQAYDKTMEENTYGGISKPLTLFGAKCIPILKRTNCALLAINQIREDMAGFGRTIIPGGKAWGHDCSLILVFKKGDYIDENCNSIKRSSSSPAGNLVNIAILKTKVCPPTRLNGYYTLKYATGVDIVNDTVELATYYDIIQKGGAWYSIIDTETGEIMQEAFETKDEEGSDAIGLQDLKFQGKASLLEYLKENKEIFNLIYEQVMKKLEE